MISELIEQIARTRPPGQLALVDGALRLTYPRLLEFRDRLRRFLASEYNIRTGDAVGLSMPNSWQFVGSFLALADLGAIAVPLSPHYRAHEIQAVVRRLGPVSVIVAQEQRDAWLESGFSTDRLILDGALQAILDRDVSDTNQTSRLSGEDQRDPARLSHPEPNATAVMLLTSGSTGSPKIVPRSQLNLICGARNVGRALGELAGRRFLGVVPFFHANGFANGMLLPLLHGGTLVLLRRFYPAAALEAVREHTIDVLIGSPFIFKAWNDLRANSRDALTGVGICLSSGSAMTSQLTLQCCRHLGARVRQLYGSTETGTISIESDDSSPDRVTAGKPIPGVRIRIGEPAEHRGDGAAAGEVQIWSEAMMTGYVGEPGLNSEVYADGYLRTGDLGYLDSQGNLVLVARLKRFINLYGVKVDPVEIEQVISLLPGVIECAVTGVKSGVTEIIRVAVRIQSGASVGRESIVEHCRRQLAEFKIPRIIEIVEGPLEDLSGKRRHQGGTSE
jgi:long-chain acyl-CoA synthetase